jgi:hypothetical protein
MYVRAALSDVSSLSLTSPNTSLTVVFFVEEETTLLRISEIRSSCDEESSIRTLATIFLKRIEERDTIIGVVASCNSEKNHLGHYLLLAQST